LRREFRCSITGSWNFPGGCRARLKYVTTKANGSHEFVERPKMGFGIPLGDWLRGPLRDRAETLLDEQRLREAELLDHELVRRYWQEHLAGRCNWQYLLWDVLMLEAWRERWT
jgi:asparagine synthetase B (glutamine-hydrolysing)